MGGDSFRVVMALSPDGNCDRGGVGFRKGIFIGESMDVSAENKLEKDV